MSIGVKADVGGTSGALQLNGVDRLLLNSDGTLSSVVQPATGLRSAALATMQKFADEFGSSLAAGGYQRLPSGLIIQWGSYTFNHSGAGTLSQTINFPIAFPSSGALGVSNPTTNSPGTYASSISLISASQATLYSYSTGAGLPPVKWIAIGY